MARLNPPGVSASSRLLMKAIALFLVLLWSALSVRSADAANEAASDVYRRYTNSRFGTSVLYPSTLVTPERESRLGEGRQFWSRDRKVSLRVFATRNSPRRSLQVQLDRVRGDWKADRARVTYARSGTDWFVLSGYVENDIFYEKTVLKDGVFHTLIWEYPRQMRRRLDEPVTRSVQAFTASSFARPAR